MNTGIVISFEYGSIGWSKEQMHAPQVIALLELLEAAALYDECYLTDHIGKENKPMFGPRGSYAKSLAFWLNEFGMDQPQCASIFQGIDYHWPIVDHVRLKEHFENTSTFAAYSNELAHFVLESSFTTHEGLAYLPSPSLPEEFLIHATAKLEHDIDDILLKCYSHLRQAIDEDLQCLKHEGRSVDLIVPPLAAMILKRSSKPENIGTELLGVREEISKARAALAEYQQRILDPSTPFKQALESRKLLASIFDKLRKPYTEAMTTLLEWKDALALPKEITDGIDSSDFSSSSITKFLIGKPLEMAIRTFRKRKIAVLFRAKEKFYATDLRKEVSRLFGKNALI